jgi:hypothetical protein
MDVVDLSEEKSGVSLLERAGRDPVAAERIFNRLGPQEQLEAVLEVAPEDRLRLIELARRPRRLIRSMAADDLFVTVKTLGPADALPFLQHMTGEQTNYVLDLDCWLADRLVPERFAEWLGGIYECGAARLERFFAELDPEVLSLLVGHWLRVEKWLPSSEEDFPPDDFPSMTLDQVYYFEPRSGNMPPLILPALELLAERRPDRYASLMESVLWESRAALEEEAYRFRTGRLMDFGFPDLEESLAVFQASDPESQLARLRSASRKIDPDPDAAPGLRSGFYLAPLNQDRLLARAARAMSDPDRFKQELVFLTNKVIRADARPPGDVEVIQGGVTRTLATVNLGLEKLAEGRLDQATDRLEAVFVEQIFSLGYNLLRQLRCRALELVQGGWIGRMPPSLHILDDPDDRILAGLLRPWPVDYDPQGQGEYRWFETAADLDRRTDDVARIAFWGELVLDQMALNLKAAFDPQRPRLAPVEVRDITLGTLLLTAAANHLTGAPAGPVPLKRSSLTAGLEALERGLDGLIETWQNDLKPLLSDEKYIWAQALFQTVRKAFDQELAPLDRSRPVDPRFIRGLLVTAD